MDALDNHINEEKPTEIFHTLLDDMFTKPAVSLTYLQKYCKKLRRQIIFTKILISSCRLEGVQELQDQSKVIKTIPGLSSFKIADTQCSPVPVLSLIDLPCRLMKKVNDLL